MSQYIRWTCAVWRLQKSQPDPGAGRRHLFRAAICPAFQLRPRRTLQLTQVELNPQALAFRSLPITSHPPLNRPTCNTAEEVEEGVAAVAVAVAGAVVAEPVAVVPAVVAQGAVARAVVGVKVAAGPAAVAGHAEAAL